MGFVVSRSPLLADSPQLLANRIHMLKKEEVKALKKIEHTRQRASQILHMREENEKKLRERLHILTLVSGGEVKATNQHWGTLIEAAPDQHPACFKSRLANE